MKEEVYKKGEETLETLGPMQLLQQIYEQLNTLQAQVVHLDQEIQELRMDHQTLLTHVESKWGASSLPMRRLSYQIQNLNVKTLSGTLNIGLVTGTTEDEVLKQLQEQGVELEEDPEVPSEGPLDGSSEGSDSTSPKSTAQAFAGEP
jgi:spore germination protein PC